MTLQEIKYLIPHYKSWKENIGLLYGEPYTTKWCTWERFIEHAKILGILEAKNDS